ncbi:ester cyclase [Sphingomonas sp. NSE70-1]|uniref:Ester cyclase n=1 Tax=Sphingomonas caseinilyticus TaxID=2908205 RepID=A0ABT0RXM5_9SPHN|nr:ester cyclase [Sphingomonas caseinilyticus]MCL6699784.1 ester cyclase [Sphingomonas caseinilyticus]
MLRHMVLALSSLVAFSAPLSAVTTNQQVAAHVFLVKMGKGDFSGLDRIYAPGFAVHSGGKSFTLDEDNESGKALRAAAPDVKVSVERMAGDGDLVAVHWRAVGSNTAASAGMPGNGKPFDVEGMTFFRFESGRIIEEWSVTDWMTLMKQLGGK